MEERYTAIEFLEKCFIRDMDTMAGVGLQFYAFLAICQSIELIGNLYDNIAFNQRKQSENRFKRGLDKFPKKYRNNKAFLFSGLRGGLTHQLRPQNSIYLCSEKINNISKSLHFTQNNNGETIFVISAESQFDLAAMHSFPE